MTFHIGLDLFPLLAAVLAAVTCALLGNFLVLRRLSLMGDAISHSVLPGLVIAFLVTASRSPLIMLAGAAIAGVITVVLVELVKRLGRVEPGAAMGVVFSVLFALGVLLIERAAVRHIDLDADCVLHGQLELLSWYGAPDTFGELFRWSTIQAIPRQVTLLLIMCALTIAFITILFKELRIAAFDPDLATTQGYNATVMHYVLMVFVAAATVASFEAVGSILVIAMLVCPAATARLLTDRLQTQIIVSAGLALAAGVLGYGAATTVPGLFDRKAVNAAGSMTLVAGLLLVIAVVLSPKYGLLVRWSRHRALGRSIALDDLLAALYRAHERGEAQLDVGMLATVVPSSILKRALAAAHRSDLITVSDGHVALTQSGHDAARDVVRRHRLWEHYLVDQAGLAPDHVHATAERLEHVPVNPDEGPDVDPHGRSIPGASTPSS
ncbi:MAG: metal ABC transporter permease [Planctomycetota bacterium]